MPASSRGVKLRTFCMVASSGKSRAMRCRKAAIFSGSSRQAVSASHLRGWPKSMDLRTNQSPRRSGCRPGISIGGVVPEIAASASIKAWSRIVLLPLGWDHPSSYGKSAQRNPSIIVARSAIRIAGFLSFSPSSFGGLSPICGNSPGNRLFHRFCRSWCRTQVRRSFLRQFGRKAPPKRACAKK